MEHAPIDTAVAVAARALFTCDAAELSAACDYLSRRVVERRNTIPIVGCLLIEAGLGSDGSYSGGSITISGTDLDLAATITLAAIVESPGAFCTPAYALAETLAKVRKASKGARVSFDHAEPELDNMNRPRAQKVTVKSGRGVYQLGTLPRDDFPIIALSCETDPIAFALPAAQFLADLAAVGACASNEEHRYYVGGAALQVRELAGQDRLCLVATDGGSIAVASRPVPIGATDLPDLILPRKTIAIIGHAAKLAGDVEAVQVTAYGTKMAFDFGAVRIVTKTIDGDYPDWQAPFADKLAASDASPALFPELLPGAPVATIERIAKAAKGVAIDWSPASQGMLGTVAGDDGLLFGALNMADAGDCQRKGFEYRMDGEGEAMAYLVALAESRGLPTAADIAAKVAAFALEPLSGEIGTPYGFATDEGARLVKQGSRVVGLTVSGTFKVYERAQRVTDWEALCERTIEHPAEEGAIEGSYSILMPAEGPGQLVPESAIVGPDGIEYPVAMSESAIHLTKEQVRALVGESCFETMQVPIPDNHPLWRTFRGYPAHVARWCYEQGDSRLLVVMKDGRCFDPKKWARDYLMRDEIDALLAGTWEPESEAAYRATGRRPALPVLGEEPEPVAAECEPVEAPEPIAIACQPSEAVGSAESVALDSGEGGDALSEAYRGCDKPQPTGEQYVEHLVATGRIDNGTEPDLAAMVADLAARVAAIEGLSVESVATSVATPIAERPRRTAAHERAVRRAWAERARRRAQSDLDRRALIAAGDYCKELAGERDEVVELVAMLRSQVRGMVEANHNVSVERDAAIAKRQRAVKRAMGYRVFLREQRFLLERTGRRVVKEHIKRERSTTLARYRGGQMVALAGLARRTQAELVQVKRTMADPTNPERSSDIARLVGERDQARNANAALEQRCARMQDAVDGCAGTIEQLASRVAIAEAALRTRAA